MPLVPPIPIQRYLVPDEVASDSISAAAAQNLTVVDQPIARGLPHVVELVGGLMLVLVAPTGLAATWRDTHPEAVVSSSDEERTPDRGGGGAADAPAADDFADFARIENESFPVPRLPNDVRVGDCTRAPVRLIARDGARVLGTMPLAAGVRRLVADGAVDDRGTRAGVRLEVRIIAWDIRAGSLRGAGDFGSRLTLAWRQVDRAVDRFSTPHVKPRVFNRVDTPKRVKSIEGRPYVARVLDRILTERVAAPLEMMVPHDRILYAATPGRGLL